MTKTNLASRCALALAAAFMSGGAWAQSAPISPSAAASAAERAQRETDRTMYWIRVLADKPAPAKATPAPAKPVAAAKPAAEPRERVKVAAAPPPTPARADGVATTSTAPASVVTPEPPAPAPSATQDPTALSSAGAEAAAVGSTAALAAPSAVAPALDVAPPEPEPAPEEPDPGLVMTKSVEPDFPAYTVRRMRKGNVEVRFEVDPNGVVVDTAVVKTSHASLNASAMAAVRQWRFKPTPKSHTALVDLVFNIDN